MRVVTGGFRTEACIGAQRRYLMRYMVAWLLGVPFSLIVLWYVVGHTACG